MEEALIELRDGYVTKFNAYIQAARLLEPINEELMMECLKKAAGCKLMIEEYNRMINKQ